MRSKVARHLRDFFHALSLRDQAVRLGQGRPGPQRRAGLGRPEGRPRHETGLDLLLQDPRYGVLDAQDVPQLLGLIREGIGVERNEESAPDPIRSKDSLADRQELFVIQLIELIDEATRVDYAGLERIRSDKLRRIGRTRNHRRLRRRFLLCGAIV